MRVLCLTRYDEAGASSRYRFYQYLPHLRAAGLEADEAPLFRRGYVEALYAGTARSPLHVVRAAASRLWTLARSGRYDLLWVEKELLPYFPALLERALRWRGAGLVVDYDDATFHQYDQHRSALVRRLLGRKIDVAMASADVVVAGNEYIAGRARQAGASVEVLPTVVDLDRYPVRPGPVGRPLTIGWIGSPPTQQYLRALAPTLATFCRGREGRVVVVGASARFALPDVPLEVVPWTEEGEVDLLRQFDVGLMPLPDDPWARGKCGFKLIQYMAAGRPVIASPVGANRDIVAHGESGFLAETPAEWLAALQALAGSPLLRERMGAAGRARVEERYSLRVAAPRLLSILRRVAGRT